MLGYPITKLSHSFHERNKFSYDYHHLTSSFWSLDIILFLYPDTLCFFHTVSWKTKWLRHFGDNQPKKYIKNRNITYPTGIKNYQSKKIRIFLYTLFTSAWPVVLHSGPCFYIWITLVHNKHKHDNRHYQIKRSTIFICRQGVTILWNHVVAPLVWVKKQ